MSTLAVVVGVSVLGTVACGDSGSSGLFGVDGGDGGVPDGAAGSSGAAGAAGTGGGTSGTGGGGTGAAGAGGGASGTGGGGTGGGGTGGSGGGTGGSGGGPCTGDGDCTSGVCHPTSQTCVACVFDQDCAGTAWCDDGACTPKRSCVNSLGCTGTADGRTVCDPLSKLCVGCTQTADCGAAEQCVEQECVAVDTCQTSLDCPTGRVCDTVVDQCVECVGDNDCASGEQCSARATCEPECVSDNQCTPLGKLCDVAAGYCVECLGSSECAASEHCAGGFCQLDVCRAGTSRCEPGGRATCASDGATWGAPATCGAQSTCVASGDSATCTPWVCTAGQTYCDPGAVDERVECAADGLSEVSRTDCAATGLHCVGGACVAQVCTPSATYCAGAELRSCAGDGLSYTVADTCSSSEYCDPGALACVPQVCTPGLAACDGAYAGTCNAEGSGLLPGATDCASTGQSCAGGSCVACVPVTSPLRALDLDLYVMVDNSGSMSGACTLPASASTGPLCTEKMALDAFANDPATTGVTMAVQRHVAPGGGSCSGIGNALATPAAGPVTLPAGATTIRTFLNGLNPTGSTSAEAVLHGLATYTTGIATPGRVAVGVFLGDGATAGTLNCTEDVTTLSGILSAHRAATGIRTFIVSFPFFTPDFAGAESLAVAGGGAPHASPCPAGLSPCRQYHVGTDTDVTTARQALESIQANSGGCTYRLPTSGASFVPPSAITLALRTTIAGGASTIPRVASAGACSGHGWYADGADRLQLCPTSCSTLGAANAPQAQATYCP
ncbi:MAG: hypothetical protein IT376_00160 [Polyangiaceae bacterium]|nr:hypothetical protein [Polyangiaceae bacterium]